MNRISLTMVASRVAKLTRLARTRGLLTPLETLTIDRAYGGNRIDVTGDTGALRDIYGPERANWPAEWSGHRSGFCGMPDHYASLRETWDALGVAIETLQQVTELEISERCTIRLGDWLATVEPLEWNSERRQVWQWFLTAPDGRVAGASDLSTGVGMEATGRRMMATFLGFLGAAIESYPDGENADLFPAWILAEIDGDDVAMAAMELEVPE